MHGFNLPGEVSLIPFLQQIQVYFHSKLKEVLLVPLCFSNSFSQRLFEMQHFLVFKIFQIYVKLTRT